jgi:hypothetical protein
MKKINHFALILAVSALALSAPAFAADGFGWWPGHWEWARYKNFNPYLEEGKKTQNTQWDEQDWYVQDWISQHGDGFKLIDGWFRTDILHEQDEEGGVPVVIVGPQFYRLSGFDKRRVMTTLDAVYGVTDNNAHPVILLKDWRTNRQIGVFTKDGLQLE